MSAKNTSAKTLAELGEFGFIDLIKRGCGPTKNVLQGIGDDTAVLTAGKGLTLLTTDMLVEGTHFSQAMKPETIGYKALACSISDVAAMGGEPTAAVISLGMPRHLSVKFVQKIYGGIQNLAKRFQVGIVGGDTVYSQRIVINVALLGRVSKKDLVLRCGAQKGDYIFVTGRLGRSLKTGKHASFTPRLAESKYLVQKSKPTAMIDISDGLVADLGHILKASKVSAVLYERDIPLTNRAALNQALYGGEDFELLFTVSPQKGKKLQKIKASSFKFYKIGEITPRRYNMTLINKKGQESSLEIKGYEHF